MSKANINNDYNYDQGIGREAYETKTIHYQRSSYEVRIKGLDWVRDLTSGDW